MALLQGSNNDDFLNGSAQTDDQLNGLQGNDTYYFSGNWGNDTVIDSAGTSDQVRFGSDIRRSDVHIERSVDENDKPNNDLLLTYSNGSLFTSITVTNQFVDGHDGIEKLHFDNNYYYYGSPDYYIFGNLTRTGTAGADSISGFLGDDKISGGNGGDSLYGDAGLDTLSGDAGNDSLSGGEHDDVLFGGAGADSLYGDEGDDRLVGGVGDDYLNGGSGANTYVFQLGDGADRISDTTGQDKIVFEGTFATETVRLIRDPGYTDTYYDDDGNLQSTYSYGQGYQIFYGDKGDSIDIDGELPKVLLPDGSLLSANVFTGSDDNDGNLVGTAGNDTIRGQGGSDLLDGLAGNDRLEGGGDDDVLVGGPGSDDMLGGAGNDEYRLSFKDGVERINDSAGEGDRIIFDSGIAFDGLTITKVGDDVLIRSATDSGKQLSATLVGQVNSAGIESLYFTDSPTIYAWNGTAFAADDDRPAVSDGNDVVPGRDTSDFFDARAGNDAVYGGGGDDVLLGGAGDDFLVGGPGVDRLEGGLGNDNLDGGPGSDLLFGNEGTDFLKGGADDDSLTGGEGNDRLFGGVGDDTLDGGDGDDQLRGGVGDDDIQGGSGNDDADGGSGNDKVDGGSGNDLVAGGAGNDTLSGGDGVDKLFGSFGDDVLDGGAGDDELRGGNGSDIIDGGEGRDIAFFNGGKADYTIAMQGDGSVLVSNTGGPQIYGNDLVRNVEFLEFGGGVQVAVG